MNDIDVSLANILPRHKGEMSHCTTRDEFTDYVDMMVCDHVTEQVQEGAVR